MTTKKALTFADTEKIDVTAHIDQKGKFSYLSWPFAVSEFRKAYPDGYWVIGSYDGAPYKSTPAGSFVEITCYTSKSCPGYTQSHPVLDNKNKTIPTPNAFQINTSIQRCLVKAIALASGIGLHIYAGEDLPPAEPVDPAKQADEIMQLLSACTDLAGLQAVWVNHAGTIKNLPPEWVETVTSCKDTVKKSFEDDIPY